MRACFLVCSLQLCMLAAEGFFTVQRLFTGARVWKHSCSTILSVVNTIYLFILTWTFGKAVMFVICSCRSVFYSNRSALFWGQSLDLWSNFLAESRFSSAVSWKNFQCLLKIAQGSTLWALIHKHTLTLIRTRLSALVPSVCNPRLHHLELLEMWIFFFFRVLFASGLRVSLKAVRHTE